MLEYLVYFQAARPNQFKRTSLQVFSDPSDNLGYSDSPIASDLVTDVYLEFITKTRQSESTEYCKTRSGVYQLSNHNMGAYQLSAISLSLDNTFKSAGKAVVVDKDKNHTKLLKGGILSTINQRSEILAWVCFFKIHTSTRTYTGYFSVFVRVLHQQKYMSYFKESRHEVILMERHSQSQKFL